MVDFSFVTYAGMPDLDPDDRLAVSILRQRGFQVQAVVWDDPRIDWSQAGTCVIRSTWDYNLRHESFLAWTAHVAAVTPLWNSPGLVRWNSNKAYLRELEKAGVAVVPTKWIARGARANLQQLLVATGWEQAVIKPSVGLSTYGVKKVSAQAVSASDKLAATKQSDSEQTHQSDAQQAHFETLLRTHDVMLQPYVASVEDYGERSLVFINGQYSHAARKTAFQKLLPAGEAGERPAQATPAEIALASRALDALPEPALYARVDLVLDERAQPLVIELELVEPTLFLSMDANAPLRFADALASLRP